MKMSLALGAAAAAVVAGLLWRHRVRAAPADNGAAVRHLIQQLIAEALPRIRELRSSKKQRRKVVVLTGGAGVGKTTLIDDLQATLNCEAVPEAAMMAIDVLNNAFGKENQKAWRASNPAAFGDLLGRIAMAQEERAAAADRNGTVLFDRTVLDNLGYSLLRGYPLPPYMTVELVAQASARIDCVLVLDQVASVAELEERNRATGRMTDPATIESMSVTLEGVYRSLECETKRLPAGARGVKGQRVQMAIERAGIESGGGTGADN